MHNKFKIENFEPQKINHAKDILDKHLREAKRLHKKEEESFLIQNNTSWWKSLIKNFIRLYK